MTNLLMLYNDIVRNMNVPDLDIPTTAVKIYKKDEVIPDIVKKYEYDELSLTACQAMKQAALGDTICITLKNTGCVAAAIAFGLIDKNHDRPLEGSRVYTDIMKDQNTQIDFSPPTPKDFTEGIVYACKSSERPEFGLFGEEDSGRYKDVKIAKKAVEQMSSIEPADTKAIFFFPCSFNEIEVTPDVIVMNVRPVELTRIIQAYQYITGNRVKADMGGLRAIDADLIVKPYLTQEINVSSYCLGSRIISQYDGNRMGIGIPLKDFEIIAQGMKESRTGFPFPLYCDATPDF